MPAPDDPVLELACAARSFGSRAALHPVSLRVHRGTVCLVHGANGSGKTTLLRVAAGLLVPTSGTRRAWDRAIYLRPGSGARDRQRVGEAVAVAARLAGTADGVGPALARAGLDGLADRRVGELSAGRRGRLLAALALVTRPGIACLDEPGAHLDDEGATMIWSIVRELAAAGCAVLVATPAHVRLDPPPDARLLVAEGTVRAVP